jgi:hypothetical protein
MHKIKCFKKLKYFLYKDDNSIAKEMSKLLILLEKHDYLTTVLHNDEIFDKNVLEDDIERDTLYEKMHLSGWKITANVKADWYVWIETFTAVHPTFGTLKGFLDKHCIEVDSYEAYEHFIKNHSISFTDLGDI